MFVRSISLVPLIVLYDFLEPTSSAFHQLQSAKDVCQYWIASFRYDLHRIKVLHKRAIIHSSWRTNLYSVVVHIYMHFAPRLHIISMNQRIYAAFEQCSFRIIGHLYTPIVGFHPCLAVVAVDEAKHVLKQDEQTSGILGIVERVNKSAGLILPVPSCAEHSGIPYRAFIG